MQRATFWGGCFVTLVATAHCGGQGDASDDANVAAPSVGTSVQAISIGPPGKALDYFKCADQHGTCSFAVGYVAYGANGSYFFKSVSGPVLCDDSTFGDPIHDVVKACYFAPYFGIVEENEFNPRPGPTEVRDVAYGADGSFFFKRITGPYTCDNDTFGDPIHDVHKQCFLALPQYSTDVLDGQTMTGLPVQTPVAYGGDGTFLYKIVSGSIACTAAAFGGVVPGSGPKRCYRMPTNARLVSEGNIFHTDTNQIVVYGSGLNGTFLGNRFQGFRKCSNTLFGGDPAPNVPKACWSYPPEL